MCACPSVCLGRRVWKGEPHLCLSACGAGNLGDRGACDRQYITIMFDAPCSLLLLRPTLLPEPTWLHELFSERLDAAGRRVHLKVRWRYSWLERLGLLLLGKHDKAMREKVLAYSALKVSRCTHACTSLGNEGYI